MLTRFIERTRSKQRAVAFCMALLGSARLHADTWTPTATNAPAARARHTAVWTGVEMIVWGGDAAGVAQNSGGRYNPVTDTWTSMSTVNAPEARVGHTAVWTGSEMIVWGGLKQGQFASPFA